MKQELSEFPAGPFRSAEGSPAQRIAIDLYRAAVRAANAGDLVRSAIQIDGNTLRISNMSLALDSAQRIVVLAAGKAAAAMSKAAEERLGKRLGLAIAVTKDEEDPGSNRRRVLQAGHPIPDERSLAAGEEVLRVARSLKAGDLLIVLLSGGASALLETLVEGVTLEELRTTTDLLLRAGAPIQDLNAVRRKLSRIKAGGITRAASSARIVCLVVSDVLGNDLRIVGSGPCIPPTPDEKPAADVLHRYGLWDCIPPSVRQACLVESPSSGQVPQAVHIVLADVWTPLLAAQARAEETGVRATLLTGSLSGEAAAAGKLLGAMAADFSRTSGAAVPACYLAGGETTVHVRGAGTGGRSQELALSAALEMEGREHVALLAAGTDGTDGPTDAAGAIADGRTASRIREAGLDPRTCLAQNDSYPALAAAGALIKTGPTGTNVNDLVIAVYAKENG